MNPSQYPKWLSNVASSQLIQEICTKSKKKNCLFASIKLWKWYNLTWLCNSPKFNLYHLQGISIGFKMVVLTPILGTNIPLHTKYLVMKYFKSSNYQRKTQQCSQIGLNGLCQTKPVAVICFYFTFQLSKSFQVPFNPFSDSCLSKKRVKTWDEEPYIWEVHAVPIKFRNKWLPFH